MSATLWQSRRTFVLKDPILQPLFIHSLVGNANVFSSLRIQSFCLPHWTVSTSLIACTKAKWSFHSTLREDIKSSQALQTNWCWVCAVRTSNSIFTLLGSGLSLKTSTKANENCGTNFHRTLSKPAAPWRGADGCFLGTELTQTILSTRNCWTTSFPFNEPSAALYSPVSA